MENAREGEQAKEVKISVNGQEVEIEGKSATGLEIKKAAIRQGVPIGENFVLQEELPNGSSRIVGDGDSVHLRSGLKFTAIGPDVVRADGVPFVAPIAPNANFQGMPALQISRKNNAIGSGPQTAVAKFLKILDFLERLP